MDRIKKINEFFSTSEKDIQGLSEQEITQLCEYAYAMSSAFDSVRRGGSTDKVALIKAIKDNQSKYKTVLDKLESITDIMSANKTKTSNESRANSFTITKEIYDYLLPIYGPSSSDNGISNSNKLLSKYDTKHKINTYYFIGSEAEYKEALERCRYLK